MSEVNDKRVLDLKEKIEEKRKNLKKPVVDLKTNCRLELDGNTSNLNIMNESDLIQVLVRLNAYVLSAKDLKIDLNKVNLYGYCITDWIDDINTKLALVRYRKAQQELDYLEKELTRLLSSEKRTELVLNDIEDTLKNM